jgi:hypothetical protein
LWEKSKGRRKKKEREKIMVLIEATTFSTSVCNANRWRMHFAQTNYSRESFYMQDNGMEFLPLGTGNV